MRKIMLVLIMPFCAICAAAYADICQRVRSTNWGRTREQPIKKRGKLSTKVDKLVP
jgi:hypothetical protein